jgi:hypothetical protein
MEAMTSTNVRLRDYTLALRSELDDAAKEHGFRVEGGSADGWRFWKSATAKGEIAVAAASQSGPFFLSVEHGGVAREHGAAVASPAARGHSGAFIFTSRDALRSGVSRAYQLGISLPTAPLEQFEQEAASVGATEAEAIVRRRIGQNVFRQALLDYHGSCCQLTGITDTVLLRASHIIPWTKCKNDSERLNVHNGLLLSSLWDAAFDQGLVSFDDNGAPLYSAKLTSEARALLEQGVMKALELRPEHRPRLAWHREHLFQS